MTQAGRSVSCVACKHTSVAAPSSTTPSTAWTGSRKGLASTLREKHRRQLPSLGSAASSPGGGRPPTPAHVPRGSCSACCSRRSAGRSRWPWPAPCAATGPTPSSGACSGTPVTGPGHLAGEARLCAAGGLQPSLHAGATPPRHTPRSAALSPSAVPPHAPAQTGTSAPGAPMSLARHTSAVCGLSTPSG